MAMMDNLRYEIYSIDSLEIILKLNIYPTTYDAYPHTHQVNGIERAYRIRLSGLLFLVLFETRFQTFFPTFSRFIP